MVEWERAHNWVLQRFQSDRAELTIFFAALCPSIRELMAVRRYLPAFQDRPPADVRASVGDSGRLELGILPGPQARLLFGQLRGAGLKAEMRVTSCVTYMPFDRTLGSVLLIEDRKEAEQLVKEMTAAGVSIQDIVE